MTSRKQYYECHVTMEGEAATVRPQVELIGWKFSAIDGDPILGRGVKCYATKHFNARMPENEVVAVLGYAATLLREQGLKVIREKVELVLHDRHA